MRDSAAGRDAAIPPPASLIVSSFLHVASAFKSETEISLELVLTFEGELLAAKR